MPTILTSLFQGSWRTRILGLTALLTLIGTAGKALLDGDPTTNVDWATWGPQVALSWAAIVARDDKVSSEVAGANTNATKP